MYHLFAWNTAPPLRNVLDLLSCTVCTTRHSSSSSFFHGGFYLPVTETKSLCSSSRLFLVVFYLPVTETESLPLLGVRNMSVLLGKLSLSASARDKPGSHCSLC